MAWSRLSQSGSTGKEGISPRALYEMSQKEKLRKEGQTVGNVASGIVGWRKLITRPMSALINYEGQFIVTSNVSAKFLRFSIIYPLFLWVRAGLHTYMTDMWNVAEMVSYVCFITAFGAISDSSTVLRFFAIVLRLLCDCFVTDLVHVMNSLQSPDESGRGDEHRGLVQRSTSDKVEHDQRDERHGLAGYPGQGGHFVGTHRVVPILHVCLYDHARPQLDADVVRYRPTLA